MNREELLQKMLEADCAARKGITREWEKGMAAALDVAVGELLKEVSLDEVQMHNKANGNPTALKWSDINWYLAYRRINGLKPKSDPAVEAVKALFHRHCGFSFTDESFAEVVAAVRKADKGLA